MRAASVACTLLLACEPPPEVGGSGDPTIVIAHPVQEGAPVPIQLDCNGDLELLVVVDIDNLTLQDPYVEGVVDVPGQGHWHVGIGNLAQYTPSFTRSKTITVAGLEPAVTRLLVSLQNNLHEEIGLPGSQASIEVQLLAADPGDCL